MPSELRIECKGAREETQRPVTHSVELSIAHLLPSMYWAREKISSEYPLNLWDWKGWLPRGKCNFLLADKEIFLGDAEASSLLLVVTWWQESELAGSGPPGCFRSISGIQGNAVCVELLPFILTCKFLIGLSSDSVSWFCFAGRS